MSTGLIILLIAVIAAVLITGVVLSRLSPLGGGRGLRRRFGPEYERAVAQHDGDTKAAEKELSERIRRHRGLHLRPLTAEARAQYAKEWAAVQVQFVDTPAQAMAGADQLLSRLARERGFPADEADEQFAALSVHSPHLVDSYRQLHEAARRSSEGQAGTEELRVLLVRAHALFEELTGGRTQVTGDQPQVQPERRHTPWKAMHRRDTTRGSTS